VCHADSCNKTFRSSSPQSTSRNSRTGTNLQGHPGIQRQASQSLCHGLCERGMRVLRVIR